MEKLNRTVFSILSFKESENNLSYWVNKNPSDRLKAAWIMIMAAYNLDNNVEYRLDKTKFKMLKNP